VRPGNRNLVVSEPFGWLGDSTWDLFLALCDLLVHLGSTSNVKEDEMNRKKPMSERSLAFLMLVIGVVLMTWLLMFAFSTPSANGQTPNCPDHPEGFCPQPPRGQPWYGQPIGPPSQWATPVRPALPQSRPGHEAVVRIIVGSGFGRSYGSGAIVDSTGPTAVVLTAAHLFTNEHGRENHSDAINVIVAGKCYKAKLLRPLDTTQDLAALEIVNPNVGRVYIRKLALPMGSKAWAYGYGPIGSPYHGAGGRLVRMVSFDKGKTFDAGEYSLVARKGDSGGPILDETGYLVGVISGEDGRTTCGAFFPRIRAFLRCVLPPYPNRPGVIFPKPVVVLPVRPTVPSPLPAPEPSPTLPTPEPSPVLAPTIDYEKLAALVYAKIQADAERFRGPVGAIGLQGLRGQAGPQGEAGPQGDTGGAGPTPAININDITQAVIAKLPPQRVRWETLDGKVLYQSKPLGEPLTFKSVEIDARK
jgi:hypothetical protein